MPWARQPDEADRTGLPRPGIDTVASTVYSDSDEDTAPTRGASSRPLTTFEAELEIQAPLQDFRDWATLQAPLTMNPRARTEHLWHVLYGSTLDIVTIVASYAPDMRIAAKRELSFLYGFTQQQAADEDIHDMITEMSLSASRARHAHWLARLVHDPPRYFLCAHDDCHPRGRFFGARSQWVNSAPHDPDRYLCPCCFRPHTPIRVDVPSDCPSFAWVVRTSADDTSVFLGRWPAVGPHRSVEALMLYAMPSHRYTSTYALYDEVERLSACLRELPIYHVMCRLYQLTQLFRCDIPLGHIQVCHATRDAHLNRLLRDHGLVRNPLYGDQVCEGALLDRSQRPILQPDHLIYLAALFRTLIPLLLTDMPQLDHLHYMMDRMHDDARNSGAGWYM